MKGQEDGGIRLECTSAGWFPEPHAVWRDPYGAILPALEEAYAVDAGGLFTVATTMIIRDCSVRNVSCSVNSTLLGQEKETVIFIPGEFPALGRLITPRQDPQTKSGAWIRDGEMEAWGGRALSPQEPKAAAEPRPLLCLKRKIKVFSESCFSVMVLILQQFF